MRRFFLAFFVVALLSSVAQAQANKCSASSIRRLTTRTSSSEAQCGKALAAFNTAKINRGSVADLLSDLSRQTDSRTRTRLCLSKPKALQAMCKSLSSALPKGRFPAVISKLDKQLDQRARAADRTCYKFDSAAELLSKTRQDCSLSAPRPPNQVPTINSPNLYTWLSGGAHLSLSNEQNTQDTCQQSEQADEGTTDGRCTKLGGVVITAPPEPPVYIGIVGNRGPKTYDPSDPTTGPEPAVGAGTPFNDPGVIMCEYQGGAPICYADLQSNCRAGLRSKIDNISNRCPLTGAFLRDALEKQNIKLYFADPRSISTEELPGTLDWIMNDVYAFSVPEVATLMGFSNLPTGSIVLNAQATDPTCQFNTWVHRDGNVGTEFEVEDTLIHEALHIILNRLHPTTESLFDPVDQFSKLRDCGESQWPGHAQ